MMDDVISRQAAIERLKKHRKAFCKNHMEFTILSDKDKARVDEIDNAIATLVNLPSAQPEPCGDVVSRNAIVQILNEMDRYVSTELRLCDTDKKFPQNEVFIVDDVYEEIVEQLPSAQPQRTGRWIDYVKDGYVECPFCHSATNCDDNISELHFCFSCGARMEGE